MDSMVTEYIILALLSFVAGGLTLFTGFHLSTILLPVFMIFLPATIAVPSTAIVHFLNNFYKLSIYFKKIDIKVLLRFGVPALLAAVGGALLLNKLSSNERSLEILLGILIISIAFLEMLPFVKKLTIDLKWAPVGGVISGFFGGLSGHQGLFRSAFLLKSGLNKTSFIATGVGIAVLVDITRLSVYGSTLFTTSIISTQNFWLPVIISTASALFGVSLATDLVKKMTIDLIRNMVYVFIFVTGVLLILGKI
ncbi:MAG: sulfite exporter TauE/SafE family protein [Candidatus Nanopelagicales bacterium]|nr:sulfite exporter TauE/SafE family protein [Candidatus Nanopelagicales bacterium]